MPRRWELARRALGGQGALTQVPTARLEVVQEPLRGLRLRTARAEQRGPHFQGALGVLDASAPLAEIQHQRGKIAHLRCN